MESRILFSGRDRAALWEAPITEVACGVWEHEVGQSVDVEVHEVFVVLAGRADIQIEGQPDLQIGPGDVVELAAGARTTWVVSEHLRKFWVAL